MIADWKISSLAYNLIVINSNPRNEHVAKAHLYFAMKMGKKKGTGKIESIYRSTDLARLTNFYRMPSLILLRHGQSTWNLENKFTGNVDVELTAQGTLEAIRAGILLKPYAINMAFTSVLKRAIQTLDIVMREIGIVVPITQSPALNERNYGDLQGMDKTQTERRY